MAALYRKKSLRSSFHAGALLVSLGIATLGISSYRAFGFPFFGLPADVRVVPQDKKWDEVEEDLSFAEFTMKELSPLGDSKLRAVKIDPAKLEIKLLTAFEYGYIARTEKGYLIARTAQEWGDEFGLLAVINAGMFHPDGSNTGYMRNYDAVNNPEQRKDYASFFVLHPKTPGLPPAQIVEATCQKDLEAVVEQYHTVIQGLRMMDCKGRNKWKQQPKFWSQAALAMDKEGKILFLHSRSPYSVHDFVENVRALPLDVVNMIYLEGGPEASLYLNAGGKKVGQMGSYETGFTEDDDNFDFWGVPNVLGVVKKR